MTYWRQAGLNYMHYSAIAARIVRQVLKPEQLVEAAKRNDTPLRVTKWKEGKPVGKTDV